MKYLRFSVAILMAVVLIGCGGGQETDSASMKEVPFETDYTVELKDNSKIFSPESRTVTGNTGKITVKNTLDAPHGFRISELGIEEVVDANASKTINVESVEPGEYTVDCQLHSAHKHGKLVVKAP